MIRKDTNTMSSKVSHIAKALVQSEALKFGKFELKAGVMSPYYIDVTWLLSSPKDFKCVVYIVADEIRSILTSRKVDKLASIELKGALLLPSVANKLNLPCIIVRKEEKKYGVTGRIAEGKVKKGEHILFFDDVVTGAQSKLDGIKPLEQQGAKVETILVLVDREQGGKEILEKQGYELRAITTISELVSNLLSIKYISDDQAKLVRGYIDKTIRTLE
jgi:orotate phosphoribosyltransferase